MKKFLKQKNNGFTLLETLVGLSIFTVSILAMMSLLASSVSDTNYAQKKIIAGYLNQEGIEYIRNLRDTYAFFDVNVDSRQRWTDFKNRLLEARCDGEYGCYIDDSGLLKGDSKMQPIKDLRLLECAEICANILYDPTTGKYGFVSGEDSGFSRKISIESINDDEIKVRSTTSWIQGSGNFSVTFSERLYNWAE